MEHLRLHRSGSRELALSAAHHVRQPPVLARLYNPRLTNKCRFLWAFAGAGDLPLGAERSEMAGTECRDERKMFQEISQAPRNSGPCRQGCQLSISRTGDSKPAQSRLFLDDPGGIEDCILDLGQASFRGRIAATTSRGCAPNHKRKQDPGSWLGDGLHAGNIGI